MQGTQGKSTKPSHHIVLFGTDAEKLTIQKAANVYAVTSIGLEKFRTREQRGIVVITDHPTSVPSSNYDTTILRTQVEFVGKSQFVGVLGSDLI